MDLFIENDQLVNIYEAGKVPEDLEEFFEEALSASSYQKISPPYFIQICTASEAYKRLLTEGYSPETVAAPIGARDYIQFLRAKMEAHTQDHSSSIAVLDRLMQHTYGTQDNIENGLLGVYCTTKPLIGEHKKLSLDNPQSCKHALEEFSKPDYQPAIIKLLARFDIEWPLHNITVEPIPPEDEMEADIELEAYET